MNFKSTIIGIFASAILLAVLGIARLFVVETDVPDLTVREIETATYEPPPPPPAPEEPPTDISPPPALTDLSQIPDPTSIAIPEAQVPQDIRLPVENFSTDLAPTPLPTPVVRNTVQPRTPISPKITSSRPSPPPAAKSHYAANELDGTPRLLRHGSASFPSSLARKGVSRGSVTFEVELSTSGSVSIRSVVSSTHPELVAPARRVASGARFTPPKKNGQPVKAIMRWPITIEK